jgi:hypothetical protein
LAEIERLFALWHRFQARQFDRQELRRRLIPLQARLGRLLRRGQANSDQKAAALCRELDKWWAALWTFARVEGVEPTNNGAERTLRPAVLRRKGSFGCDSEAGSRFVERLLTIGVTCRQQGLNLVEFLMAAGEAAAGHGGAIAATRRLEELNGYPNTWRIIVPGACWHRPRCARWTPTLTATRFVAAEAQVGRHPD